MPGPDESSEVVDETLVDDALLLAEALEVAERSEPVGLVVVSVPGLGESVPQASEFSPTATTAIALLIGSYREYSPYAGGRIASTPASVSNGIGLPR